MPSPGLELEQKAVETSEPATDDGHFPDECEDFTKDIEVGGIDADSDPHELESSSLKKKAGRHRPRKKKLYADICGQMEFYFSDANISKNRMMQELVTHSEYVDLHNFLEFHKIQKISPDINVSCLQKALAHSQALELSPDLSGVKRKVPYNPQKLKSNDEIEKCTIYVENVPTHVDHEWLEKIFQEFGPIAYIAMPKFRHNGLPKGFAFVEFKDNEGAEHCLNAYGDIGSCLPDSINPEELLSVRTFEQPDSTPSAGEHTNAEGQKDQTSSNSKTNSSGSKKRRREDSDAVDDSNEVPVKRDKAEDTAPLPVVTDNISSTSSSVQASTLDLSEKSDVEVSENGAQNAAEKKKRRKTYKTKKMDSIEKRESDSIQLKILPKKIWRQLRNRYLNLQRENLGKLKRQLRNEGSYKKFEREEHADSRRHHSQHIPSASETKKSHHSHHIPSASEIKKNAKNVIAKIEFQEPMESAEIFKNKIINDVLPSEWSSALQFVDYSPPNCHAYVRLDGSTRCFEGVGEFLRNATNIFKNVVVLSDKESQDYWSCVRSTIKADSKKKVRGRDKLLQQAMKTATHIRFGEGEDQDKIDAKQDQEEEPVQEPDSHSTT